MMVHQTSQKRSVKIRFRKKDALPPYVHQEDGAYLLLGIEG